MTNERCHLLAHSLLVIIKTIPIHSRDLNSTPFVFAISTRQNIFEFRQKIKIENDVMSELVVLDGIVIKSDFIMTYELTM